MSVVRQDNLTSSSSLFLKVYAACLGIALSLLDVGIVGRYLGPSGASIGGLFLLFFSGFARKFQTVSIINLHANAFIFGSALISILLMPTQPATAYGELIWLKALKVGLALFLLLYVLKCGQIFFLAHKNLLYIVVITYFGTLYIGVLLEKLGFFPNVEKSFFHSSINFTQRPRGFATEPSNLAYAITVGIVLFTLLEFKLYFFRNLSLVCLLLSGFVVTESRGYIGSVALAIPITLSLIFYKKVKAGDKKGVSRLLTTLLLLQGIYLGILLRSESWSNWSRGVSDATREIWAEMSIVSLQNAPIGAGFQSLLTTAPIYLNRILQEYSYRFESSSLQEVSNMVNQSGDFAISPKSLTTIFVLISGVFGLMFLWNIFYRVLYGSLMDIEVKFWELFGVILLLITLLNYSGGLNSFAAFFVLGIIIQKWDYKNNDYFRK